MAKKAALKTTTKMPATPKADDGGEDLGTALVAMPKSTALSTDVGMIALNHLAALATDEQMIDELRSGKESHRGKAQVLLAIACHKAGMGDKSINLAHAVTGNKSQKNLLGKQIRLAIGLMVSDGQKTVLTPEANATLNAMPGDDARTLKRKKSIRANFSTMLTKSMRVALHAIEQNLAVKEENGLLAPDGHEEVQWRGGEAFRLGKCPLERGSERASARQEGQRDGAREASEGSPLFH